MTNKTLFAGASQLVITPGLGTRINGDFVSHYAQTIHDDLFSRALILKNNQITIALVVVDICVMSEKFIDEVKHLITLSTSIPPSNILIAANHTHAAGAVEEIHLSGLDITYREVLPQLILESVEKAIAQLVPAKIAFGKISVPQHVVCRRYYMREDYQPLNPVTGGIDKIKTNPIGLEAFIDRPVSPVDPEVGFIAVRSLDNHWISILANYSLHYVGDWENGTISADYFGIFSKFVEEILGSDEGLVAMMSNGTSGDVNIWDFMHPGRYPDQFFAKSEIIARDIATALCVSLDSLEWQSNPELKVRYASVTSKVRKPSSDEWRLAADLFKSSDYNTYRYDDANLRKLYAREQLLLHNSPPLRTLPLQVIQIGRGAIGALPGEFFAETGLWLKDKSPFKSYFTISMANGNVGYVPPDHQLQKGGYETWRCRYSCLEAKAEENVREKLLSMLRELED